MNEPIKVSLNFEPRDYQLEFLNKPERFKIAVWHRRSGKSKSMLNLQIIKSQLKKGIYYYFLPTYRQAKSVIWDELITQHAPEQLIKKKNDSELTIYYKNGSIQHFVGCEDIDRHRGINPIDVVFDEYSEMNENIWKAIIQPVLRENKGTATFIYTPKGRNHAYTLLQFAKDNIKEWYTSIKTVADTKALTEEEINEAIKSTPKDLYDQEYMCVFLDGAGQFFRRIKENIYEGERETGKFDYQIGCDLAKFNDYTVITPFNLNTFHVHAQERFNQIDYNLQKSRIEAFYHRFNKGKVVIDSTGVGEPVYDDLRQRGIEIDPFTFTSISREQLLRNLQLLFEQDKIKIPKDEGLIEELQSFRYELTRTHKVKIGVPDNLHDDRVMSLALSVWGVKGEPQKAKQKQQDDYMSHHAAYMNFLRSQNISATINNSLSSQTVGDVNNLNYLSSFYQ